MDAKQKSEYKQEDFELWKACAAGNAEAREKLILANRPMVYWLAKKLKVNYYVYQDIIQEGMIALINAVDSFDLNRNIRFSTYAYYKIHGQMVNYLQRVVAKEAAFAKDADVCDEGVGNLYYGDESSKHEWSIDLENALSQLSESEADIINALIMEGRVAKDVAFDKNINISAVYRIKKRALAKLKSWLCFGEEKTESAL